MSRSAAAWLQTATALGAHVVGAGCLPQARSLAVTVPLCVAAILVLGRLLPRHPVARLAAVS